jgi:uncharacterized membrane protein SirB2
MDSLAWVLPMRQGHLALVVLSGTLFAVRGLGVLAGARWPLHKVLRVGSVVIDTLLLTAGVMLWSLLQLNPMREHWLGAKLVLLVLYIVLGSWALKRAQATSARAVFFVAALTVFATMVSIGWTRHPLGMWRWL